MTTTSEISANLAGEPCRLPYHDRMLRITLNGEEILLDIEPTVARLVERQGLQNRPCAVEVNRRLVSRNEHASYTLADGDVVEIVTLVGGG